MEKQLQTWNFIAENLQRNIPVMLLYVLQSRGSSPGRQGFFMAVNAQGSMQGSIGGGIMEYKFVGMAKHQLLQDASASTLRRQIHDKAAPGDQSGMICSGEQTVFVYRLPAEASTAVQQIIASLLHHKNGLLQLSPDGLSFSDHAPEKDFSYHYLSDDDWKYEEKTGYKNRLHIIGAGHCALALSRIMRTMDFYIHLYDDRPALNTFAENTYAHEKKQLGNYGELKELIASQNDYVVVMTIGYRTDDLVIRTLMDKRFLYFGVLGSKKKLEQLFNGYKEEGVNEAVLARIHAPVGMPVNSRTPEEIAISIAAEIISVKNK